MKFRPGQKVLVKQLKQSSVIPRRYFGKVVTILTDASGNPDWPYRIGEDPRWVWREEFFASVGDAKDPNIIFELNKRRK